MSFRWRACLFALLVWTMFVTVLRAVRLPNDFAEAHWLLDYRFGFIKRGLIGALFGLLAEINILRQTETTIRMLSFATFAVFCIALLVLMWRILARSGWSFAAFVAVAAVATSPAIVMNAHLVGYFDHNFMVLSFIAAWLVIRGRPWSAAVVMVIAVLVHESVVLAGFPLVLLAAYLCTGSSSGMRAYLRVVPVALLPALAFLLLVLVEARRPNTDFLSFMLANRLSGFLFIQENRANFVPEWLTTPIRTYWSDQSHRFPTRLADRATLIVIPTVMVLLGFTIWRARAYRVSRAVLAVVVTLLPLALHAVAWDTGRISAYMILTSFGSAWVMCETSAHRHEQSTRPRVLLLTALPVLVFNSVGQSSLMDGQIERFSNPARAVLYAPLLIGMVVFVFVEQRRGRTHETRSPAVQI